MAHLSRIAAPKSWSIPRKGRKWVTRTSPGPHSLESSINLSVLLKYVLNYANTNRDIKRILNNGEIKVDSKIRKDLHFPIGLMDTLSFEKINEYYRLLINKNGKFILNKISKEESTVKPYKVINKTVLGKDKIQLNLTSGKNIIINKDEFKVSDTLLIDISNNKIREHIPLKEGAVIYLIGGSKIGHVGKTVSIFESRSIQPPKIIFSIGKEKHETLKEYAFVIGVDSPNITVPGNE